MGYTLPSLKLIAPMVAIATAAFAQSPYDSPSDFANYALKVREQALARMGPPQPAGRASDGQLHRKTFPDGFWILYRESVTPSDLRIRQIVDYGSPDHA